MRIGFAVAGLLLLGGCATGQPVRRRDAGEAPDAGAASDAGLPPDAYRPRVDSGGPLCGDGAKAPSEACDDGNTTPGDGCSDACAVEDGYACPTPNAPCVPLKTCGDGVRAGGEACDDRNTDSGDGCSASCAVEAGWTCPIDGVACRAAGCGDGIVAGFEECEDGDAPPASGDGCDASCLLETGYVCEVVGRPCVRAVCGNGVVEGTEPCDDANNDTGDGCSPFCEREPVCSNGTCTSACGDGVVLSGEPCDDGNSRGGDGCSADCTIEEGFECELTELEDPAELVLPAVYRDFRGYDLAATGTLPRGHIDFQNNAGAELGIVGAILGADGLPLYARGGMASNTTHGRAAFDQWYRDSAMSITVVDRMVLTRQGNGVYVFDSPTFFPVDGRGWVAAGGEVHRSNHNFHFTSIVRYWFEYHGDEVLDFRGDDDVWVFINGRLAMDLGGVHFSQSRTVTLSDRAELGLVVGGTYEVVVFQAERHTPESSYRLTLSNFSASRTTCTPICGDGVITRFEACDDGVNDGSYGGCMPGCTAQARRCGDGVTQSEDGEQCDMPPNLGVYGGCGPTCTLGPHCGDGTTQRDHGEECDDANQVNDDSCDNACRVTLG